MIDKICDKLMKRIRAKMPEVDDERAEVIKYGLELIIGEIPKFFITLFIAWILGVLKYTLITILIVLPYRISAGGLHLKSHIGCILGTTTFYVGSAFISKIMIFPSMAVKVFFLISVLIFSIIMITLYAPADTENVPILQKKVRKEKKIKSYISILFISALSIIIKDNTISNICMVGMLIQSINISKFAYSIFKLKFGYLEYIKNEKNAI